MISELKKIFFIIGHNKNRLYFIVSCFLVLAAVDLIGIGLVIPYINLLLQEQEFYALINKYSLNFIKDYQYFDLILLFSFLIILIFFIKTLILFYINYSLVKFDQNISLTIKKKLINSYLNIDYEKYINFESEKAVSTITNVSNYVSKAVVIPGLRILSDIILIIFISIFLSFVDFNIFFIILVFLTSCIIFYNFFFKNILFKASEKMNQGMKIYLKGLSESSSGYKEFTVLNTMDYFKKKIDKGLFQIYNYGIIARILQLIPSLVSEFIIISFFVIIILFKIFILDTVLISEIAKFGVFALAGLKLFPKFTQLASNLALINSGKFSVPIIYKDLKDIQKNQPSNISNIVLKDNKNSKLDFKSIEFIGVNFAYNNSENKILKDLNLTIKSQNIYGLFGSSGSGKTTFVDILLKFLKPDSGKIIFNKDFDFINDLDTKNWHSLISYIPQKITLLNGSILENITMEANFKKVDYDRLNEALRISRSDEFIKKISEGINYQIGESGIKLSGGQLQRIALARSIYFNRRIIILDEATNALDLKIEEEILKDLSELKENFTIILITHREKVLNYCTNVLYLNNGKMTIKKNEKK